MIMFAIIKWQRLEVNRVLILMGLRPHKEVSQIVSKLVLRKCRNYLRYGLALWVYLLF